jgi:6-phosphogluconate dehydrogenase
MTTAKAEIGVIGLAVMGRNLALNLADHGHGHGLAVYNRSPERTDAFVASEAARARRVTGCATLEELVGALAQPRAVLLMVKAGAPADEQIEALAPLLSPGDLVIDGGNSHHADTARRAEALAGRGLLYLGVGISGGEAGARHGPSIMAGGEAQGFARVERLFRAIAAKVDGAPCCALLGPGGAGHYVKMVHNGIEYAVMQLIAEAYVLMRDLVGLDHTAMQAAVATWAEGPLDSYLVEITADILGTRDPESARPLVEVIADRAGHKGTGRWAGETALALGVPAPTIIAGYLARCLSVDEAARAEARASLAGPAPALDGDAAAFVGDLERALAAAVIIAYGEGFALLTGGSAAFGWDLDLATVARIWRGGCIVRTRLLDDVAAAYRRKPGLRLLATAPPFAAAVARAQDPWRRVVAAAVQAGLPVPALSAALWVCDAYRSERLWTALVQAQRDYFGAHGYERTDRPGSFHTEWGASGDD